MLIQGGVGGQPRLQETPSKNSNKPWGWRDVLNGKLLAAPLRRSVYIPRTHAKTAMCASMCLWPKSCVGGYKRNLGADWPVTVTQLASFWWQRKTIRGSDPGVWASGFLTWVIERPYTRVYTPKPVHIHTLYTRKTLLQNQKQENNDIIVTPCHQGCYKWARSEWATLLKPLAQSWLWGAYALIYGRPQAHLGWLLIFLLLSYYINFVILVRHTSHKSYHLNTLIQISQGESVSF